MKRLFTDKNLRQLLILNFFFGGTEAAFYLRSTFLASCGVDAKETGVIFAVTGLIGAVAPIIGGFLADRVLNRHKVYLLSLVAYLILILLTPISGKARIGLLLMACITIPAYEVFFPVAQGIVETVTINATNAAEGTDYAHVRLFMSIGFLLFNVLMTPVMTHLSLDACYYVLGCAALISVLLQGTVLRNSASVRPGGKRFDFHTLSLKTGLKNVISKVRSENPAWSRIRKDLKEISGSYYLLTFLLLSVIVTVAQVNTGYLNYLLLYNGLPTSSIGLISGLKVIGEIFIMLLFPLLRKKISLSGFQILGGVFFVLQLLFQQAATSVTEIILFEILGGIANGLIISSVGHYLRALSPFGLEATALLLRVAAKSFGNALFSIVEGNIIENGGIIVCYRFSMDLELLFVVLLIISLILGKYVFHKENVCPLFFVREKSQIQH